MRRCAAARNRAALAIEPCQHEAPALDVTAVGLSVSPRRDDADGPARTGRRRACAGAPKQPRRRSADQASGHDARRGRGGVRLGRLRWPIARPVRQALGAGQDRAHRPAQPTQRPSRPRRSRAWKRQGRGACGGLRWGGPVVWGHRHIRAPHRPGYRAGRTEGRIRWR